MFNITLSIFIILIAVCPDKVKADEAIVRKLASQLGKEYNIKPELIQAIVQVESNYNPKAVGASHGEVGLMQLHPKYFPNASFDPAKNMAMGVKYLAKIKLMCYPKFRDAWFICYNLGPRRALTTIKKPTMFAYYKKVTDAKKANKDKGNRVRVAPYQS